MPFKASDGPKVVRLTNSLAQRFAEMEPAPGDREERKWRREEVARCVKEGTFRAPEWASAFCKETGIEYRINGKHTSKELADMNGSLPAICVILTRFECDTLRDVAELYSTYDKKTSVRNARDVNRSYQMSHPDLAAIPSRWVSTAVSGIAYAQWAGDYHPQDEKSELMFPNIDFCKFVYEICSPNSATSLRRTGTVAAMFKTFQRSQKDSLVFWTAVREASGHPASVPDRKLREKLITTACGGGRRSAKGLKTASMHEFLVMSIQAWNAWRNGDKHVNFRYSPDMKTPSAK